MTILDKAIQFARSLDKEHGKQRVCAIITDKKGRIISIAANSYTKSSPFMHRYAKSVGLDDKIYWHAECKAVHQLSDIKRAYKIYVARVSKKGATGMAAPCPICAAAIQDAGIKVIELTV